jgi:hypothetical protein
MSNYKRLQNVRSIVERHVAALSRELAEELTRPLLEQLLAGEAPVEIAPVTVSSAEKSPLYDRATRKWHCPRCTVADLRRRAVTTHMRFCEGEGKVVAVTTSRIGGDSVRVGPRRKGKS